MSQEHAFELAKVAPPVTVTSMTLAGFPMSDWVLLLTAIYTVIQIYVVSRKALLSYIDRKHAEKCGKASECPNRQDVGQ